MKVINIKMQCVQSALKGNYAQKVFICMTPIVTLLVQR
jgi:hypothetical protein